MTVLRGDINAHTTAIPVDAPLVNPTYPFFRDIDDETVKVVAGADTTEWQVERGVGDSQQVRHAKNVRLIANASPFGGGGSGVTVDPGDGTPVAVTALVAPGASIVDGTATLPIFVRTVSLTNAQIKALPSTPVELVPAPGAGKRLSLISAFGRLDAAAGAYTNLESGSPAYGGVGMVITFGNDDSDASTMRQSSSFFSGAIVREFSMATALVNVPDSSVISDGTAGDSQTNKALNLVVRNADGDLTGGNAANTLKVSILYVVLDV